MGRAQKMGVAQEMGAAKTLQLAIQGGSPVRDSPMPLRFAIGERERQLIDEVLDYYHERGEDPGYQGTYEERYCSDFVHFMGGGYADAVATGTSAVFVALAALQLPKGSEVLVSPITDPGTLSAIIMNGLVPVLVDTQPNSYNVGAKQVQQRLTERSSCVLVVHSAGQAAEIEDISYLAQAKNLKLLEDCSQSHGAFHKERRVGTFGDIAAFSTMYRKPSIAGGSGGVVFTRSKELHRLARSHADRGKPYWLKDFDDRDPSQFLFPALNLHTDELSCAIGIGSIARLDETRRRRLRFASKLTDQIEARSATCHVYQLGENASPFFLPMFVDADQLTVDKITFARAIQAEGIGLNPDYKYLVYDWPWIKPFLSDNFDCPNARRMIDTSFNLYLNERYADQEVSDIVAAIVKVESVWSKKR